MESTKHKKHVNLAMPNLGFYGRNEWAILGTTCDNIKALALYLSKALSPNWELAYVDADHKGSESGGVEGSQSLLDAGATIEYADKIAFQRLDTSSKLNEYQYRQLFNNTDIVLVNGNHFTAIKQVVVIDPKKEDSLKRKLDRLTHVDLVLLTEGVSEVPSYLTEALYAISKSKQVSGKSFQVLPFHDFEKISAFFSSQLKAAVPPLHGLVLAGGKSKRMRFDKGLLDYHGKPQREYMGDLLSGFCKATHLSCRFDQVDALAAEHPPLFDTFFDLGPMGALLSAFRVHPNSAFLAVACDLPFLDEQTIKFLVDNRNPSAIATSFRSPVNEFPEPLVAIWEPKSYPVLLQFLAQGHSCPRKVLINSKVHLLDAPNPMTLRNVNTPEEFDEVIKVINNS